MKKSLKNLSVISIENLTTPYIITSHSTDMPTSTHDSYPGDSSEKGPTNDHAVSTAVAVSPSNKSNVEEHIDAEEVVGRANQLFGFDDWSSEICEAKTDFVRSATFHL